MIVRRVATVIPIILIVTFLVSLLETFIPGDPAVTLAGENPRPEQVAEIRESLGLDDPLLVRYVDWLGDAAQGDLGSSLFTKRPVTTEIASRWPVTISLVFGAVVIATIIGGLTSVLASRWPGGIVDRVVTMMATVGVAIPNFLLGIVLLVVFAVWLQWFPLVGYVSIADDPLEWARHLVLPWVALSAVTTAEIARQLRSSMSTAMNQDYIRTARAKGVGEGAVTMKHALRVAAAPAISVLSVQVVRLLGGAVIVEQIFGMPGLGSLVVDAVLIRDLPVLQGVIPLAVVIAVVVNLLSDLLQMALNPRLRVGA